MLKKTGTENCSQCTNTTKVSASKPTQKIVYWNIFVYMFTVSIQMLRICF